MLGFYGGFRMSLFLLKRAENLPKAMGFEFWPNLGSGFLKLKFIVF